MDTRKALRDVLLSGNLSAFSTSTPLGIGGTYSSGWIQHVSTPASPLSVEAYANAVVGSVSSDQSGTLYVDYSFDGVNVVATESISLIGGTPVVFDRYLRASYVKVRYVNGGVAQTSFILGARLANE